MMRLKGEVFDLIEACDQAGCPVCTLTSRTMEHYFDRLLYGKVNDIYARASIRTSWGFCNRHAHMLLEPHGGSLGVAIIYQDVLKNLLRVLDGARWQGGSWGRKSGGVNLADGLEPKQACPACVRQAETESAYTRALAHNLGGSHLAEAFEGSDGLCWRHLRMALGVVREQETFEMLVRVQRAAWEHLEAELAEFIRKNDHRFQHEEMGPEGDSWQRVVSRLSGERGVGGREDREVK